MTNNSDKIITDVDGNGQMFYVTKYGDKIRIKDVSHAKEMQKLEDKLEKFKMETR